MQLSEEVRMLRDMVDDFGQKEVMDIGYAELEPKGEFPEEFVKKISDMGLMGISFPEEYGGMGMDTMATSVVGERLAFYWPSLQLIWSANVSLAGFPIMIYGNENQKQRFLPNLASGKILGCYALTEPDAGSDAANIKTTAEIKGQRDLWVLNGTKTFITNATNASVGIVFARIAGKRKSKRRHEGITAFLLSTEEPGLKRKQNTLAYPPEKITVRKIDKWGLRCSDFCEIILEDVHIAEGNVLGEVGGGFRIAMETLNNGRINIAAQAVGIARRALHEMKEYARSRKAFDKRLMDIDEKAKKIAWLETQVEAAWLMVLRASQAKDGRGDYRVEASQAKLFASRVAKETADFFSEFAGGVGYTLEYIAERIHQDARATLIYEGTSDIQELVIAKSFRD